MDFSLTFSDTFSPVSKEDQMQQVLATNSQSMQSYALQLTPEDSEALVDIERSAAKEQALVMLGDSIVPRLIRRLLPTGYLATGNYALNIAKLTEVFYAVKGELQDLYDNAGFDCSSCRLSDNAILYYMSKLFEDYPCCGDPDILLSEMQTYVCQTMARLLNKMCNTQQDYDVEDPLYGFSDWLEEEADWRWHTDTEWDWKIGLQRNPELLLPSRRQEQEWDRQAEAWEEEAKQGGAV